MAALQFPTSSAPGTIPGEGSGRLVNMLALKVGGELRWGPAPGLDVAASPGFAAPRGGLLVGDAMLQARQDNLFAYDMGNKQNRIGALPGSTPITAARDNYAAPAGDTQAIAPGGPHVVFVTDSGVFIVVGASIEPYPNNSSSGASIGAPGSVAFQDGYFHFLYPTGELLATGTTATPTNTLDWSDQSYTKCESAPQNWLRVTASAGQIWAFGDQTIEVYSDQGLTPYPYARAQVIPVGLYGKFCVAGFEPGWDGQQLFVAADRSVRQMNGYTPVRISTREVERDIEAAASGDVIRCCCYTFGGNAIFSVSGPEFTWEYNCTTQQWHERLSQGMSRWRAETSVSAFGKWFLGDVGNGDVLALDDGSRTEGAAPVICRIESAPLRNTPDQFRLGKLLVDITTGQGVAPGAPANCLINWSLNGGGTWSNLLVRAMGQAGQYGARVQVGDLGRCLREGVRVGITVSDPVPFSLRQADLPNLVTRSGG